MRQLLSWIGLGTLAAPAFCAVTSGVLTSVEVFSDQTGAGTTAVREYLAFDEAYEYDEEIAPYITSMRLSINGGTPIDITANSTYNGQVKRRESFTTSAAMLAARPLDASYAFALNGSSTPNITIQGPGSTNVNATFEKALPNAPTFSFLSGASGGTALNGTWSTINGRSVFTLNAAALGAFRVRMSDATMQTAGDRFEYRYAVADITNAMQSQSGGQISMGEGGDWGLVSEGFDYNGVDLAFYKGAQNDNSDSDSSTFGFTAGRYYQIEGEFFNHFNLTTEDPVEGAFVFGSTTSVVIYAAAIPEPSSYAAIVGGVVLAGVLCRRRRRR